MWLRINNVRWDVGCSYVTIDTEVGEYSFYAPKAVIKTGYIFVGPPLGMRDGFVLVDIAHGVWVHTKDVIGWDVLGIMGLIADDTQMELPLIWTTYPL